MGQGLVHHQARRVQRAARLLQDQEGTERAEEGLGLHGVTLTTAAV